MVFLLSWLYKCIADTQTREQELEEDIMTTSWH